jgi:cell division septum initiation protein DivIVA
MDNPITWAMLIAIVGLGGWLGKVAHAFGRLEGKAAEAKRIADAAKQAANGVADATKEEARRITEAVKKETESFSVGLAAVNAAFNLFQVTAAKEYITRNVLKEFEDRLNQRGSSPGSAGEAAKV